MPKNKLDMNTMLETKVRDENFDKIKRNVFGDWEYITNNDLHPKGHMWLTSNQNIR